MRGVLDDTMMQEHRAYKQADYGKRLIAYLVDSLLLWIPIFFLTLLFEYAVSGTLVNAALHILYGTYFESSKTKATLGKQMLGLQVMSGRGEALSVEMALKRNVIKYISWALFFLTAPYTFLINKNKRTPYDEILHTMVVSDEQ